MVTPVIGRVLNNRSKTLDLSRKQMKKCPDTICQLLQLEKVILTNNKLNDIPDDFGDLKQIQFINISGNEFEKLPCQIQHLSKLKKLVAYRNKIKVLPVEIFRGLKNLTVLNLNTNELVEVPAEIGGLISLKYFSAEHNQLRGLPDGICLLQQLEELCLGYNNIVTLPFHIGQLHQLKELYLHRNNLKELPKSISKCTQLKVLDVASNDLNIFPLEFEKLQLERLHYECNPLLQLGSSYNQPDISIFPLKEMVVRFAVNEMRRYYPSQWSYMKQIKEVQQILKNGNHCLVCDGFFSDIWFETVSFLTEDKKMMSATPKEMHQLSKSPEGMIKTPKGPIPIQVLLCSQQCFNNRHKYEDEHIDFIPSRQTVTLDPT